MFNWNTYFWRINKHASWRRDLEKSWSTQLYRDVQKQTDSDISRTLKKKKCEDLKLKTVIGYGRRRKYKQDR